MDEVKGMKNAVQHKINQLQDEMKKNMVEVWETVSQQVGVLKIEMKKKMGVVQKKVGGKLVIVLGVL